MNAIAPAGRAQVALKILLNLTGIVTGVAIVAVFMPLNWMDSIHRALNLGPVPEGPVFEYLARSISAMYAIHGGLCLVLARDVRRFGPVITYVGVVAIGFAGIVLWIDSKVGLPKAWVATEAPTVLILGVLILVLRIRMSKS